MAESKAHRSVFLYICPEWSYSLIQAVVEGLANFLCHNYFSEQWETQQHWKPLLWITTNLSGWISEQFALQVVKDKLIPVGFTVLMGLPRHEVKGRDFHMGPSSSDQ